MSAPDDHPFEPHIRDCVDRIRRAVASLERGRALSPNDMPSSEETRELLGLFARLPSEDLRQGILRLMRAIIEVDA